MRSTHMYYDDWNKPNCQKGLEVVFHKERLGKGQPLKHQQWCQGEQQPSLMYV